MRHKSIGILPNWYKSDKEQRTLWGDSLMSMFENKRRPEAGRSGILAYCFFGLQMNRNVFRKMYFNPVILGAEQRSGREVIAGTCQANLCKQAERTTVAESSRFRARNQGNRCWLQNPTDAFFRRLEPMPEIRQRNQQYRAHSQAGSREPQQVANNDAIQVANIDATDRQKQYIAHEASTRAPKQFSRDHQQVAALAALSAQVAALSAQVAAGSTARISQLTNI